MIEPKLRPPLRILHRVHDLLNSYLLPDSISPSSGCSTGFVTSAATEAMISSK